jgi:hypothetical protein
VLWLIKDYSRFILQLIADVLSISSAHIVSNLLPGCLHLICGSFLPIIKNVCSKSIAHALLGGCGRASVVLATPSTASATVTAASTATIVSASSAAHNERGFCPCSDRFLRLPIFKQSVF